MPPPDPAAAPASLPEAGEAYRFAQVERAGRITLVTLDRPEVLNALHAPAHVELDRIFDDFAADDEQWVAIVTGAGRAFCAGNDLKYQAAGGGVARPRSGFGGLTSRFDLHKPVIAAVNGLAMGGGFEIALACDLVVASEDAVFALPEPKVGLAALAGGLHRLPRLIGRQPAMGMILTGRTVNAAEGRVLGFVNAVTPAADLLTEARRWAQMILECSPLAIRTSKDIVDEGLNHASVEGALAAQRGRSSLAAMLGSEDYREGPSAFAQKRKPRWSGR